MDTVTIVFSFEKASQITMEACEFDSIEHLISRQCRAAGIMQDEVIEITITPEIYGE